MYDHSKVFFSEKRAKEFAKQLEAQGHEVSFEFERDRLNPGSNLYYVKWN